MVLYISKIWGTLLGQSVTSKTSVHALALASMDIHMHKICSCEDFIVKRAIFRVFVSGLCAPGNLTDFLSGPQRISTTTLPAGKKEQGTPHTDWYVPQSELPTVLLTSEVNIILWSFRRCCFCGGEREHELADGCTGTSCWVIFSSYRDVFQDSI